MWESLLTKLKKVEIADIVHIFFFLVALPISRLIRIYRKNLWLICEYKDEAHDNGFCFFHYLRMQRPEIDAVYAIGKNSKARNKVVALGDVVSFGSLKHWIYYLAAQVNVSSQKGGKPNAAVCYILEVYGLLKNFRVFIQHGIILNDLPYLHKNNARFSLITCGATPEYEFVKERFGYSLEEIAYTGMCRYDRLYKVTNYERIILVFPTWRNWLKDSDSILMSDYFNGWNEFLNHPKLHLLLEKENIQMRFLLHRNMVPFTSDFSSNCPRIDICNMGSKDIMNEIQNAAMLITDYSSVSVDFAYLKRPLIYYQFDYKEFRNRHLEEGYFSYARDGFGNLCTTPDEVIMSLLEIVENQFTVPEKYLLRYNKFFAFNDEKNCQRTYEAIVQRLLECNK